MSKLSRTVEIACVCLLSVAIFSGVGALAESPQAVVGLAQAEWKNLPGVDGKEHSLADLRKKKFVVVAITCNHCPIAIEYFERMKEFATEHGGPESDVALVAISVSQLETDKLERMKTLAEREEFNFAYLYDESQEIARQLGASVTPQFFVLDEERKLVFRGPWDDHVNRTKVTTRYVEEALEALRQGQSPPIPEVKSVGCAITYER